ncbi:RING finger protein 37-like [Physella acuta]|uniref:RING finger protein 37-like n=1 Tax=Physella acuta TaxID=109671 RepID=UPI0027DC6220|nr:RING finger protein 37-like [Physella acuta]
MLVNFALDILGTTVEADKVSTDGHECANLISSNWQIRRKGFLAESFIKPPVNITFTFPCWVSIDQVVLTPSVGQQQSMQIELLSASRPVPKNYESVRTSSTPPLFFLVSKLAGLRGGQVCFYNSNTHTSLVGANEHYECKVPMKHGNRKLLHASSHIILRITRTHNGSTSAVSNVSIWGVPASFVPFQLTNTISNKYKEFIQPSHLSEQSACVSQSTVHNETITVPVSENKQKDTEIPEEFLDCLTWEVMTIPMLLPCGKNVDKSTIDRYIKDESYYGRKPRDPFTGVEFSDSLRPLPNGALKTRIDRFLIQHSMDRTIGSLARTVSDKLPSSLLGKRKLTSTEGVSSLVTAGRVTIENHITETTSKSSSSRVETTVSLQDKHSNSNALATSKSSSSRVESTVSLQDKHSNSNALTTSKSSSSRVESTVSLQCYVSNSPQTSNEKYIQEEIQIHQSTQSQPPLLHEEKLKDSLNSALSLILKRPSNSSTQENCDNSCWRCKTMLTSEVVSYLSPCDHAVCRDCLIRGNSTSSDIVCGVCSRVFEKKQLIRKHN